MKKRHQALYLLDLMIKNNYKKFAEIGLWKCKSIKQMIHVNINNQIDEYWGVDNFNLVDRKGNGYSAGLTQEIWDSAYFQACELMINNPSLKIVRMKSMEASELFKNEYLDMVFIDGSHDYDSVMEDIECWEPKIRKGGIISGHDYNSSYVGVKKAVDSVYKDRVKELPKKIWYVNL